MIEIITPESEQHWHELRAQDITSTDCAALFGMSPYCTPFELWHRKREATTIQIEDNERMCWGRRLEAAIAYGIAEDEGWQVRPFKVYVRDPEYRIGASFDFEVVGHPDGQGLMEIKNVDRLVYMKDWQDDEAPPHIEIQAQHQLAVTGYDWTLIAALVGGNTPAKLRRKRDDEVVAAIRAKAREFWRSIEDNKPPSPVFPEDAAMVVRMHQFAEPGTLADLRKNPMATELATAYKVAGDAEKAANDAKQSAKAELLLLLGDREKALLDGFSISAGMVGPTHIAYDREGYRNFRVTAKKPK